MSQAASSAGSHPSAPRVLILLCTYNEYGNLPRMFELLAEHVPEADVLIVDDASPDGTAELVREYQHKLPRVHLLQRQGKLGLGSAIRAGMQWCLQREYEYLVNLDADLSHDPAAIPQLITCCQGAEVEVAIGSRYIAGGSSPGLKFHRKVISRMLNGYATWMLSLPMRDCSGSFRCYQTSLLNQVEFESLHCDGYGFLEEILVALKRVGARFSEVPIAFDCRYRGVSKLSLQDSLGAIQLIHRLAWRRSE